jgi:hypothetical protein
VELPVPEKADYAFQPERQIFARLLAADEGTYFWGMPFAAVEFRGPLEKLGAAFFRTLEVLIRNETRITQRAAWLQTRFDVTTKRASVSHLPA